MLSLDSSALIGGFLFITVLNNEIVFITSEMTSLYRTTDS